MKMLVNATVDLSDDSLGEISANNRQLGGQQTPKWLGCSGSSVALDGRGRLLQSLFIQ
jgi:hypothetical protein